MSVKDDVILTVVRNGRSKSRGPMISTCPSTADAAIATCVSGCEEGWDNDPVQVAVCDLVGF